MNSVILQEHGGERSREHLERVYVFALMWSVGALLELDDRKKMEVWLRRNNSFCLNLPDIPSDSEDTMFDYHVADDGKFIFTDYPLLIPSSPYGFSLFRGCHSESRFSTLTYLYLLLCLTYSLYLLPFTNTIYYLKYFLSYIWHQIVVF